MIAVIYSLEDLQSKIRPIAEKYDIPAVYLFGSYARGEATEKSDIDILIQRKSSAVHGLLMGALYNDLNESFEKEVDLVTVETLEQESTKKRIPWFVENLQKERLLIYAKQ
jgi:predicted nucleotidyltransferase